jgi:predicted NodU family carbamoyl transferase
VNIFGISAFYHDSAAFLIRDDEIIAAAQEERLIYKSLKDIGPYNKNKVKLLFPEHHLSHAASAYFPSPFEVAAILTMGYSNHISWKRQ